MATTKDLNVYANFPLGINTARFVVTDKELGTKAFKNFKNTIYPTHPPHSLSHL